MLRISQLLILVAMLAPCAASAAEEHYGAIAYSSRTKAHGWAKDYPARAGAEKAALANCAKHADDCGAVLWFKNACGALATGPKGAGWAWAQTQETADRNALIACGKHSKACTVKQRVCTTR
jgi:Domain of unknown function (DUF4189)